jgi:NADPH:quinone reductase-like Zn-dependent oxidoreductase
MQSSLMSTMKAWSFAKYGPPSVLALTELTVPEGKPGDVRVQVRASAINPSDVKNVAGVFHTPLPRIPGRDYVGTVVAGSDAWKGKEVWGSGPGFGVAHDGTHAQFVLVPIDGLSEKPTRLSVVEAATVGVPYLAAWVSLVDAAAIQSTETILVTGASGAVGRAATQIAHWKGAKVIGADIREGNSDADHLIITTGKDLAAEVKSLTNGVGVDMVLDAVGGPMFEPALNSLRRGGRQVVITSVGTRRVELDLIDFYHEQRRLIGVDTLQLTGARIARIMDALREGFDEGHLKPSPTTTWPFSRAVEAYGAVESGRASGTQVLLLQPT